jgi:hypothetical protein
MELKLNVYGKVDGKRQIIKTVESDTVFVMTSTVEDLLEVIDLSTLQIDKLSNDVLLGIGNMLIKAYKQLKPLIMDVFEDLTEEEYKHTSQKEVLAVATAIIKESFGDLIGAVASQAKN